MDGDSHSSTDRKENLRFRQRIRQAKELRIQIDFRWRHDKPAFMDSLVPLGHSRPIQPVESPESVSARPLA